MIALGHIVTQCLFAQKKTLQWSGSVLRQTAILYHHYKIWICFLFQIAHFSVGTYYILPLLHNYVQYRQDKNKETQFNSVYELKSQ